MRQLFHHSNHQAQFTEKGFVIVDLINPAEARAMLQQLSRLKPDDNFHPQDRSSDYHCTFLDTNKNYKRAAYELICAYFKEPIEQYLIDFAILNGNFYIKPKGSGRFEIHQNWHHNPHPAITTLTVWCPLVDVNQSNGTLEVVPSSHKIVPDIATVNVPYYFHNFEQALLDKYLQPIPLKAGQGLIFDDSLIHYSSNNDTAAPRYAIQIETHPQEMNPVYYHFEKDTPEKGFEVFEVDRKFFMQGNITNMTCRPKNLKSLGFIPNTNRLLTEEEFQLKMKKGPETRDRLTLISHNSIV